MSSNGSEPLIPEKLRRHILNGECVVFIGSGPSMISFDGWHDLVNNICKSCGIDDRVTRDSPTEVMLAITQNAKEHSLEKYLEYLGSHFGDRSAPVNILYNAMLALPFRCYFTLNFDPLLAETAKYYATQNGPPKIFSYPQLDRRHSDNKSIHYLHGYVPQGCSSAPDELVLSSEEFELAYRDNGPLSNFLMPAFTNDPILFIGCGLNEPSLKKLFDLCNQERLERDEKHKASGKKCAPPPRYILLPLPEVVDGNGQVDIEASKSEKNKLSEKYMKMDIEPRWYAAKGNDHSQIRLALDELAQLNPPEPKSMWEE